MGKWSLPKYDVPRDEEDPDFVKSFRVDESEQFIQFFEKFGFVVIRDVLSQQECTETLDDIWTYVETRGWAKNKEGAKVSRHDSSTWMEQNWPPMAEEGILGFPPVFSKIALRNRAHDNVYKVFRSLLNTDKLLVNQDRYGLFRPTVKVPKGIDDKTVAFPTRDAWKTMENIHFDMNPWDFVNNKSSETSDKVLQSLKYLRTEDFIAENNQVGVMADFHLNTQALINLADNRKNDGMLLHAVIDTLGGFHLVPGFKNHLEDWVKNSPHSLKYSERFSTRATFIILPSDDPLYKDTLRITMRAGSLCIWDQRTLHGSAPNSSPNIRYAQFLKVFPVPNDSARMERRANAILKILEEQGIDWKTELTETQKKMFGLVPYEDKNANDTTTPTENNNNQ